jgi:hypothetical protein
VAEEQTQFRNGGIDFMSVLLGKHRWAAGQKVEGYIGTFLPILVQFAERPYINRHFASTCFQALLLLLVFEPLPVWSKLTK